MRAKAKDVDRELELGAESCQGSVYVKGRIGEGGRSCRSSGLERVEVKCYARDRKRRGSRGANGYLGLREIRIGYLAICRSPIIGGLDLYWHLKLIRHSMDRSVGQVESEALLEEKNESRLADSVLGRLRVGGYRQFILVGSF